jgi:hypothetical protein
MTQADFLTFYVSTLFAFVGVAGVFIKYLIGQIKRLESRVDDIYDLLLERQ